jgi:hypothetical protein
MRLTVRPCLISSTSETVKTRYGPPIPPIPPLSAPPWDLLHSLVALLGLLWCAIGFPRRIGPEDPREDHCQDRSEGGQDLVQPKAGDLRGFVSDQCGK